MKIVYISLIVSMLWHPICYIVDILIEDYDKSTELVYSN